MKGWLLIGILLLAESGGAGAPEAPVRTIRVMRRADGGELVRLVLLSDGGAETRAPDGGTAHVNVTYNQCVADAGTLFDATARRCRTSSDCEAVRPGVAGLPCCVSLRHNVAVAPEFAHSLAVIRDSARLPDGGRCDSVGDGFTPCTSDCIPKCQRGVCDFAADE